MGLFGGGGGGFVGAALGGVASITSPVQEVLGGLTGYTQAEQAADALKEGNYAAIAQQQQQFDAIQALLKPYIDTGTSALGYQANLLGVNGADAQQQAIEAVQNSPGFQEQIAMGENALLQNASATGGLRGGNLQGALATFRPQMLNQAIQQRIAGLGGLAGMGQASAAGQANLGQNMANSVSGLLQGIGTAGANKFATQGGIMGNLFGQAVGAGAAMLGGGF